MTGQPHSLYVNVNMDRQLASLSTVCDWFRIHVVMERNLQPSLKFLQFSLLLPILFVVMSPPSNSISNQMKISDWQSLRCGLFKDHVMNPMIVIVIPVHWASIFDF